MNDLKIYSGLLFLFILSSCGSEGLKFTEKGRQVPQFSADSAYAYNSRIVSIGDRIPNSSSHEQTKIYLSEHFRNTAGPEGVFLQRFSKVVYGDTLLMTNIIAAFNTSSSDRILLSAHWDSRPRSDMDPDYPETPLVGADDGGSGVAVLMELARLFSENPPPVGVDIVLFDGEDYGRSGDMDNYFLGSRHWAQNPPVPGYSPRFGILLDMVGAREAVFPKEGNSMSYAPNLVNEVWDIADEKGYGDLFVNKNAVAILDDHEIINRYTTIPMIDIVNISADPASESVFPEHWHTLKDNMDIIDKNVLNGVGAVLSELIYNRL